MISFGLDGTITMVRLLTKPFVVIIVTLMIPPIVRSNLVLVFENYSNESITTPDYHTVGK